MAEKATLQPHNQYFDYQHINAIKIYTPAFRRHKGSGRKAYTRLRAIEKRTLYDALLASLS